jgi:hypothetical protein
LPEAAQDARAGLTNVIGGHVQLLGQGRRGAVLYRAEPEGPPGAFLEFSADQLQGPLVQFADLVGLLLRVPKRFAHFLEVLPGIRTAYSPGLDQSPEWFDRLRNEAIAALALPDIHLSRNFEGLTPSASNIDLSHDFELYTRLTEKGTCSVHRVADDKEVAPLPELGKTTKIRFGPGRLLLRWGGSPPKCNSGT